MLKDKLKLIVAILTIITMIFTYSTCFAVDNEVEDLESDVSTSEDVEDLDESETIEEDFEDLDEEFDEDEDTEDSDAEDSDTFIEDSENSELSSGDMVESDLYLINGGDVTIDYDVDGNAYIMAKSVTITSQIGGDAFIIAESVNIEDGLVYNNLFVMANNIYINGMIYDLYATGNNITIGENGYIYRDVHSVSDTINILGSVGRNVTSTCKTISFISSEEETGSNGKVYGNLDYSSPKEATIEEGFVDGNISFNKHSVEENGTGSIIMSYLSSLATYVATAVLVFLLILWLAPRFRNASKELLSKKIGPVIGLGLLGLCVIPLAVLLLLVLGITSKLALAVSALYAFLILIAASVSIVALTEIAAEKLNIDNKWKVLGLVACASVILWLLELIPFLGGLITFVTIVLGFGIVIKYTLSTKKEKSTIE